MHDSSNISIHPACVLGVDRDNFNNAVIYTYCMAPNGKEISEK